MEAFKIKWAHRLISFIYCTRVENLEYYITRNDVIYVCHLLLLGCLGIGEMMLVTVGQRISS